MTIINLPNGAGEILGDSLVVNKPLEYSGNVWYVSSILGTDAGGDKGKNRNAPLATLAQAQTNAANGDMIVLMDGHTETYTSVLTITKDLTIVGAGQASGKPTVKLLNNQAAGKMFEIESTYIQLRNIYFPENVQTCSAVRVNFDGTATYAGVRGCYFECGGNDEAAGCNILGTVTDLQSTTFECTSTDRADQPFEGVSGAGTVLMMEGLVLDGGVAGFSSFYAANFQNAAPAIVYGQNVSLLNGADLKITASTEGYINVQTSTGGARIDWCGVADPG